MWYVVTSTFSGDLVPSFVWTNSVSVVERPSVLFKTSVGVIFIVYFIIDFMSFILWFLLILVVILRLIIAFSGIKALAWQPLFVDPLVLS